MIKTGLLNPQLLSLLARVRHTNALVIADRGFPFWPMIETVDLSVIDGLPTVCQIITAVRANHHFTQACQAEEFLKNNPPSVCQKFAAVLKGVALEYEPHVEFKKRVPGAIGLIRTGDTAPYANTILISG